MFLADVLFKGAGPHSLSERSLSRMPGGSGDR